MLKTMNSTLQTTNYILEVVKLLIRIILIFKIIHENCLSKKKKKQQIIISLQKVATGYSPSRQVGGV